MGETVGSCHTYTPTSWGYHCMVAQQWAYISAVLDVQEDHVSLGLTLAEMYGIANDWVTAGSFPWLYKLRIRLNVQSGHHEPQCGEWCSSGTSAIEKIVGGTLWGDSLVRILGRFSLRYLAGGGVLDVG